MHTSGDHRCSRRLFARTLLAAGAGGVLLSWEHPSLAADGDEPLFKISLAEWSLNRALFGGKLDNRDFAKYAKTQFGIDAIEYVNQFFKDKANDKAYLAELNQRAGDLGVKVVSPLDGVRKSQLQGAQAVLILGG